MNPAGTVTKYEYDDGTAIETEKMERIEDPVSGRILRRSIPNQVYWVVTSDGERFIFDKERSSTNRRNAYAFAELWYRTGGFDIPEEKSAIPVAVAVLGNSAMVVYLQTVSDFNRTQVSEMMDIAETTVSQYINKFRKGQR